MATETVWFETAPRPFAVPEGLPSHHERVGLLLVSEGHDPTSEAPYRIRFEAEAHSLEELWEIRDEASKLAQDLDLIWPYVAGVPLFQLCGPSAWRTVPRLDNQLEETQERSLWSGPHRK